MAKIKVENFGPINGGVVGDDEFLYFEKVTILIGNQATGKSSVAKLISTISWIEKSLYKKELSVKEVTTYNRFRKKYCAYQGIDTYFKDNTIILYYGEHVNLFYRDGNVIIEEQPLKDFRSPKIMYVPAERNFLSVVEDPGRLKNLPLPLYTFLEEFETAKRNLKGIIPIPVAKVEFEYQRQNKISYIKGDDYKVRLKNASSGIQSLLPLYMVSKNLAENVDKDESKGVKRVSLEQEKQIKDQLDKLLNRKDLTEDLRELLLEQLNSVYRNLVFINIVEEPEQNLYPKSQMSLLFELFKFNNMTEGNKLLLTTHSPYILNYTSLAIKAKNVVDKIKVDDEKRAEEWWRAVHNIVPEASILNREGVYVYEMNADGSILRLKDYNGIPSDENHLNQLLAETNDLFDQLLELEEEIDD
ncbi:AAA family ATPase [Neolewinella lacunae]|uniref:ATP-binding protein n=1 Tax=Neolewinella lacunae TaxID=1517758 RepID=A0A923T8A0_9BACT|nr:AAA family ATPase [Neolewinella lacunae]MBC6994361.1 ATP-binding protein [Neolewinella lacunae]MDN3633292.1 AAA family ATPase [Neolewinella lacunae]